MTSKCRFLLRKPHHGVPENCAALRAEVETEESCVVSTKHMHSASFSGCKTVARSKSWPRWVWVYRSRCMFAKTL